MITIPAWILLGWLVAGMIPGFFLGVGVMLAFDLVGFYLDRAIAWTVRVKLSQALESIDLVLPILEERTRLAGELRTLREHLQGLHEDYQQMARRGR